MHTKHEAPYQVVLDPEEEQLDLKALVIKYLRFWPLFLAGLLLAGFSAWFILRYAPVIYVSTAKIMVLDKEEESLLALDPSSLLGGRKIILENEIQVLKSYRMLQQVVDELSLDVAYFQVGDIKTSRMWVSPFVVTKMVAEDSLPGTLEYQIALSDKGFLVSQEGKKSITIPYGTPDSLQTELPFRIGLSEQASTMIYGEDPYKVVLTSKRNAVLQLMGELEVAPTAKESDILSLSISGEAPGRSETILNTLVDKFNQDGILDRQRVSQRTLDFIDDRFAYLTQELDSIETGKQSFKEENQLSYIEADAGITLSRKSEVETQASKLETQTYLTRQLREVLEGQANYTLLPGDVGLENLNLNTLVAGYNELALEREKVLPTMGENHPMLIEMNNSLERRRVNILKSLNIYEAQLRTSLSRLKQQGAQTSSVYSRLPEKERMLRAIERQQNLKEALFLVLLQKREEAAIELAVTSPSIKVIDYALTGSIPSSPKRIQVYGIAILLGLLIPFGIVFLVFSLDTKIHDRKDVEKALPNVPFLAEIPFIPMGHGEKEKKERSTLSESFRILGTNMNFLLRGNAAEGGRAILVTSSIKGEGKTLIAVELAKAYSNLQKKVLLVGTDLRNPRLHEHFEGMKKNVLGLSDYLSDSNQDWESLLVQPDSNNPNLNVVFSGRIPPNAPQLLSGSRFEEFLSYARRHFDIVLIDTAPTILVTDTLIISDIVDASLYVTRAKVSEKKLLEHVDALHKQGKLKNIGIIINDVHRGSRRGYGYGYGYGYNYGYGYGYSSDKNNKPWYKRVLGI
ncbi:MAG: hypothetical protein RLZZ241_2305 [Bacteroidota bacterium]|jgi:capsular exopolysaccharide synthesis family protein